MITNETELREKLINFMKTAKPAVRMLLIARSKKYRDIYEYVLQKTKDIPDIPFTARVYFVISNDYSYRKCSLPGCNNDISHKTKADPFNGYAVKYCCNSCAQKSKDTRRKIEETSLKKYGTRFPQQSKEIRERVSKTHLSKTKEEQLQIIDKRKATCLEKYGTEFAAQNESVREKMKEKMLSKTPEEKKDIQERTVKTNIRKYGVKWPSQSNEVKERTKQNNIEKYGVEWPMQVEENKKKRAKTVLEKYGVEYISQADVVKQHTKETFIRKFGVEHPMMLDEIKEKQRNTFRKHFGVDSPLQDETIKEKTFKTNIERYGGKSPMCSHDVRSKARSKYVFDDINFDSGAELAYYIWLKDNGISFEYHPKAITYVDNDNVERKYFPDFLVDGKLHEIKGDYWWKNASDEKRKTVEKCVDKILFKRDYAKYLLYVKEKYGDDFIINCKRKKHE